MTARAHGQTRLQAAAPLRGDVLQQLPIGGQDPRLTVTRHLIVDSRAFRRAGPQAFEDLQTLLAAAIVRAGGDPDRIVWSAEPVGPQIELAAVNGRTL